MNALIKALEHRGFKVTCPKEAAKTTVRISGEEVDLRLCEISHQSPHVPKPKEYYHRAYDYTLTGKFALSIETWAGDHRRTWRDCHKQRLEDCLNAFILALVASAEASRLRTLRWEKERMEREERERQWQEQQQRKAEEEKRRQALINEVNSWHLAGRIRSYVQLVRDEAARAGIEIDPVGELASWMAWASKKAAEMDPLPSRLHTDGPLTAHSENRISAPTQQDSP